MQHERFTETCTVYFKQTDSESVIPPATGKTAHLDFIGSPALNGLFIDVGGSINWIAPNRIDSIKWEKNAQA